MLGDGRTRHVSFFDFRSALGGNGCPRRVLLNAEMCQAAGIIFNAVF